jgi:hypothetical protein
MRSLEEIIAVNKQIQDKYENATHCKDCGTSTKPGKGSARCPACWEDRCGNNSSLERGKQPEKYTDFINYNK